MFSMLFAADLLYAENINVCEEFKSQKFLKREEDLNLSLSNDQYH